MASVVQLVSEPKSLSPLQILILNSLFPIVARSWGDKVHEWMVTELNWDSADVYFGGGCFNPFAGLISALSVLILSLGVQESKTVTNVFTLLKVLLVIFMIVVGLSCFRASNLQTFSPYGVTGILRGATSSFFGYLGFDEVSIFFKSHVIRCMDKMGL